MKHPLSIFFGSFILMFLVTAVPCAAQDDAALAQIAKANDHYAKSQYKEAASLYQDLINRGFENGYLYYNLGNTYIRMGQTGPSILNYIRAKRLLPRDESLTANLNYAIQKTKDQLEPKSSTGLSSVFFWVNNFNLSEHLNFLLIVNLLFWTSLGGWTVRRTEFWSLAKKITMTFLFIAVLSFGVKMNIDSQSDTGVILAGEVAVKSAQGVDNVTLFQLHEGAVVSIVERKKDWVQIELNDGKKGWTQSRFIGV
ncbi:MAG: hypothetical protein NPINA01_14110 [Nitrospinaceae bacterium]|nr:MAG: hypothetical protein NPINA01_14110 [Nitrospinaceae bacterium]